ncbi:hypothetical protein I5G60_gp62 [Mycobacterium phage Saguaro]|uniref:DUF7423 domain-containing protein n=1 Tax=Mycobacterium phage Saguaro TaxID=2315616 RepID=A0A386KCS1_9CAUD|nr:hypothetical protein I5G60_gp62 [Mycobacterium phage Saguaro]AYD82056.1 hypothetical protein SEA_SAGUARO_62 [Mycobacterium phage Saguaro]
MTHNLPAAPDPGTTPLSQVPTAALIFTLGFCVARPEIAHKHYGGIAAIADELSHRRGGHGEAVSPSEFTFLMAALPRDVAGAVEVLYRADRGQRMAGYRRTPSK